MRVSSRAIGLQRRQDTVDVSILCAVVICTFCLMKPSAHWSRRVRLDFLIFWWLLYGTFSQVVFSVWRLLVSRRRIIPQTLSNRAALSALYTHTCDPITAFLFNSSHYTLTCTPRHVPHFTGGSSLREHALLPEDYASHPEVPLHTIGRIREGGWDYVVLQQQR